jgi:hypothetical protein
MLQMPANSPVISFFLSKQASTTVVSIQRMMEEYNINQTTLRILGLYRSDYSKTGGGRG